jgi:hypothetical protein
MFRPAFRITPRITAAPMQTEACRQAVDDLPMDATILQHLRETAALAATRFSTFNEGNQLTLSEAKAAVKGALFGTENVGAIQLFGGFLQSRVADFTRV